MKKHKVFAVFLLLLAFMAMLNFVATTKNMAMACDRYVIKTQNSEYIFEEKSVAKRAIQANYANLSAQQKRLIANKMSKMGFDKQTIVEYLFPNIIFAIDQIEKECNVEPQNATVEATKNCKIQFKNGQNGIIFDKNQFINAFFDSFDSANSFSAKFVTMPFLKSIEDIKPYFVECSRYATDFSSSGQARKNNILLAVNAINGKIIKPGEEFSFNQATGARGAQNGYMSAKIIVGGKYVDGFGGGVCQVSTTLYNAALLCGFKITEAHPHSLPSSYVEAGFDAMVNMGSSDLKFINQTDNDYIITASAAGDICKVVIYGTKPQYTIKKRNNKYEVIAAGHDEMKEEYIDGLDQEYSQRMSYAAEGYKVKTYLDYYNENGLVKTEQLRDCKYNAKNGLVVNYKKKQS